MESPRTTPRLPRISNCQPTKGALDGLVNYGLCLCLRNGDGLPRNSAEAAKFFKFAADQADAFSQAKYGLRLKNGDGVERDMAEGARYVEMAADEGFSQGENEYGLCLKLGEEVPRDLVLGAKYFKMVADQGDPEGQLTMGYVSMW
jgi:TPR repeat protein